MVKCCLDQPIKRVLFPLLAVFCSVGPFIIRSSFFILAKSGPYLSPNWPNSGLIEARQTEIPGFLPKALLSGAAKPFSAILVLSHVAIVTECLCRRASCVMSDTNSRGDADAPATAVAIFVAFLSIAGRRGGSVTHHHVQQTRLPEFGIEESVRHGPPFLHYALPMN